MNDIHEVIGDNMLVTIIEICIVLVAFSIILVGVSIVTQKLINNIIYSLGIRYQVLIIFAMYCILILGIYIFYLGNFIGVFLYTLIVVVATLLTK
ncbi:putative membrane protein [Staphylococcus phage Twort]|uniref:Membrane protein n=2 Tax=Staphylococcus phage Twort (strain DSM 17442 / HER 48) TaxID=2908167 RepID=A0A6H0X5L5_BPTWO|nr:putative membrane protein [Staphylococcus phage Twort]